jgi:hypothetical protein
MGTNDNKSAKSTKFVGDEAEIRAAFAKLQAKRDAGRARRQTPEFKAAQAARNKVKAAHVKNVLAKAAELGLKLS